MILPLLKIFILIFCAQLDGDKKKHCHSSFISRKRFWFFLMNLFYGQFSTIHSHCHSLDKNLVTTEHLYSNLTTVQVNK